MTNESDSSIFIANYQTGTDGIKESPLTKREFFASNCPEVPDWFDIEFEMPKPTLKSTKDESLWDSIVDLGICKKYESSLSGTVSLPEHLKWFADAYIKDIRDKTFAYKEWQIKKYFSWRAFYADNLIDALNK